MSDSSSGLLDTNVVILREELDHRELPHVVHVSTVTVAELAAGPHHAPDIMERARRLRAVQKVEAQFDPLPFDRTAAQAYGEVVAAELVAGRNPRGRIAELMIASIAVAHGIPLFTVNPADFAALTELLNVVPVSHPTGN